MNLLHKISFHFIVAKYKFWNIINNINQYPGLQRNMTKFLRKSGLLSSFWAKNFTSSLY